LKLHGFEVDQNIAKMKTFAAARQQATGVHDESIALGQIRLLDANIDLADSYRLVAAAQDLSVAKDMELVSAADLIGKSIDSDVNALGRYGIQIDKTLPKQQQINQLLAELESRFGGRAAAAMEKTAGKMALLSSETSNVAENLFDKLSPGLNQTLDDLLALVGGLDRATKSASDLLALTSQQATDYTKQGDRIRSLATQYDFLTLSGKLNAEQQGKQRNIIAEIAAFMPGAVSGWNSLNEAVEINTDVLRANINAQEAYNRRQNRAAINAAIDELKSKAAEVKLAEGALRGLNAQPAAFLQSQRSSGQLGQLFAGQTDELARQQPAFVRELNRRTAALKLTREEQLDLLRQLSDEFNVLDPSNGFNNARKLLREQGAEFLKLLSDFQRERRKQEQEPAAKKEVGPLDDETISRTLQAYESLISSGKASASQLNAIWSDYTGLQLGRLEKELNALENISTATKAAIIEAEKLKLADAKIDAKKAPLDRAIALYQPILASQKLTVAELDALWGPYSKSQLARIELEAQRYDNLGATAKAAYRQAAQAALDAEKIEKKASIIQRLIDEQKKLLDSGLLSASTLEKSWAEYTKQRTEELKLEIEKMTDLRNAVGLTLEDISLKIKDFNETEHALKISLDTRELRKEFEELQTLLSTPGLSSQAFEAARPEVESRVGNELEKSIEKLLKQKNSLVEINKLVAETNAKLAGLDTVASGFRDQQIAGLEILLRSNALTASELESVWSEYYALQLENLADLQLAWEKSNPDRVGQLTADFKANLENQEKEIEAWGESWEKWFNELDADARKLAEAMSSAFEDTFFRTMEGEFVKFRDFVKAIINDITRYMAQEFARLAAQSLTRGLFNLFTSSATTAAGGNPDLPSGSNFSPAFASGGLITSPTFALIGEAGPEVVVPMPKLNDGDFWRSLGLPEMAVQVEADQRVVDAAQTRLQALPGGMTDIGTMTGIDVGSVEADMRRTIAQAPNLEALADRLGLPKFADGGIVTGPTIALLGERGTEMVLPTDQPGFWDRVNPAGDTRGGDSITIQMTVVTPDVASFKASSSQLMAEAQVRAGQAFRRNR